MAANKAWEKSQKKPVTLSHNDAVDIMKGAIDAMVLRCEIQGVTISQEDCSIVFENMYETLKDYINE